MPCDVIAGEGVHEEIRVVITFLHPHLSGLTPLGHHVGQRLGAEQVKELIACALIDEQIAFPAVLFEEQRGIVIGPGALVIPEICAQLLAPPIGLGGIGNRREGRQGIEQIRIAEWRW